MSRPPPSDAPEVSVVVAVYRCRPCLEELCDRTRKALLPLVGEGYEIVMVEDSGDDGSWEEIERLAASRPNIRGAALSRNFGQHAAITAGLAQARGRWALIMDCDLQDPPELIPELWAKASEGFNIVYGARSTRPSKLLRRLATSAYFRAMRTFAGGKIDGRHGTFSLISRNVIDRVLDFKDVHRHYPLILAWLGFRTATVEYTPHERFAGESSYSMRTLLSYAADGVFFQTTVLLRWIVYLGFSLAALGALAAAYFVAARLVGQVYAGWTSIVVFTLIIGGFIITSTGITGLYIGKVFEQVKQRPLFVIERTAESGQPTETDVTQRDEAPDPLVRS